MFNNPKHLKKHERNLKRKQRKLSRKQDKTTSKRRKAKRALAKVHSKISPVREDFLHKLSRKIVNENQVIVAEDLAVKNMVKNHNLAKSISDAGWGMFQTMLKYKAEQDGKIYLEIGRFFPSSHLCNTTLLPIPKMDLSVRTFLCPHCQKHHNRDVNAAMTQTQVAEQLGLRYQHLNRSVRKLVDREVLEEGPSIGRIRSYRLNPEYGYKGKVTNLQKTLQNRKLTVIKGGA